jgi:hypothetical protein
MKRESCPLCHYAVVTEIAAPPVGIGAEHFAGAKLGLSLCRGCGVRFVNPRPSNELLSAFYDRDDYECHDPNFAAATAPRGEGARLRILREHGAGGALCDFGPGAGHLLRAAKAEGWEVCGVEAGAVARHRLGEEGFTIYPDLLRLPRDLGVRTLTMVHVLEHLTEPLAVLAHVRELLTQFGAGVFYVEVPNADSLRARLAVSPLKPLWTHAPERYLAFPIHLLYFNQRSLRLLLTSAGFRVIEMGTLGLGVEELFAGRANGTGTAAARAESAPPQKQREKPASLLQPAKEFIKSSFSRFRLGENLYAVCRPV